MNALNQAPVFVGAFEGAYLGLGGFTPMAEEAGHTRQIFKFNPEVSPSDAALSASQATLKRVGLEPSALQFVISCTQTPDFNNPGLVSLLLYKLGALKLPGLEIKQMSNGLVSALELARNLILTGQAQIILVNCTDFLSRYFAGFDASKASSAQIAARDSFGDGSASCLVLSQAAFGKLRSARGFYQLESIFNAAELGGREAYICKLPGSSRFPERLNADDVERGRHFPELDTVTFLDHLGRIDIPTDQLNLSETVVTHQLFEGMSALVRRKLALEHTESLDVFESRGHIGSAGLVQALSLLPEQQRGKQIGALGVASGIRVASMTMRAV